MEGNTEFSTSSGGVGRESDDDGAAVWVGGVFLDARGNQDYFRKLACRDDGVFFNVYEAPFSVALYVASAGQAR